MILTITPSPAIDWTVRVPTFELGAVNRAVDSSREASGKGINVSWALHRAGRDTHALFPAGGSTATFMADHLEAADLAHTIVPNDDEVRTNISLVVDGSSGTKINEPGAPISSEVLERLLDAATEHASRATLVLSCGSLPPGAPADFHGRVVERCASVGVAAVVDTSGTALRASLAARPTLIKPNVHELADLTGRRLDSIGDVIDAARTTIADGPTSVLVSLGGDGALLVEAHRAVHGVARDIPVVNTVGAGDALLAGYVAGDGDVTDRLRTALLWASSAVACATTLFPLRDDLAAHIDVYDVTDTTVALREPGHGALA